MKKNNAVFATKLAAVLNVLIFSACFGVSSEIVRHRTGEDFLKGDPNNIVIGSQGTLTLSRPVEIISDDIADAWVVNTAVAAEDGSLYIGTSPNGIIYKYADNQLTKIYEPAPVKTDKLQVDNTKNAEDDKELAKPSDSNDSDESVESNATDGSDDTKTAETGESEKNDKCDDPNEFDEASGEEFMLNEHVFALGFDSKGNLLAGISGDDCRLIRIDKKGNAEVLFKPQQAYYIFSIVTDSKGRIYLATGPDGKVYTLDKKAIEPDVIFDAKDKNIISMAIGDDGMLYAGSDSRGVLYRIDPESGKASVMYDTKESDITAMFFDEQNNLYFTAASAKSIIKQSQQKTRAMMSKPGRADGNGNGDGGKSFEESDDVLRLQIANSSRGKEKQNGNGPLSRGAKANGNSFVYKLSPEGFVTVAFSEPALFLSMVEENGNIILGTGNKAELFTIEPGTERMEYTYKDEKASQITSLCKQNGDLFVGTANPARLICLKSGLVKEGFYDSELIDAKQPARWGKLQVDADVPEGASIELQTRSGNIDQQQDDIYSDWSTIAKIEGPTQMDCPVGRFAQYRLLFKGNGKSSPVVRQVALAHVVENIAPKVLSVDVAKHNGKQGVFAVGFVAKDENNDTLTYTVDLRQLNRDSWITIKEDLDKAPYEWDSRTVEDGIYEIRVTASDEKSNSPTTSLSGSWISDPVVVDNTPAVIEESDIDIDSKIATLKLKVSDKLSMISGLAYTVDSNDDWISTLPDDLVFDTKLETFTIVTEKLEKGEHIISVKLCDDAGNVTYKSFYVVIK